MMIEGLQTVPSNCKATCLCPQVDEILPRERIEGLVSKGALFSKSGNSTTFSLYKHQNAEQDPTGTSMHRPNYLVAHRNCSAKWLQYAVFGTGTARTSHTATLYIGYQCALSPSTSLNKKLWDSYNKVPSVCGVRYRDLEH